MMAVLLLLTVLSAAGGLFAAADLPHTTAGDGFRSDKPSTDLPGPLMMDMLIYDDGGTVTRDRGTGANL
ncbi:hypothetical protein Hanom_Chr07g00628901 [Helianthus anomalus]